MSANLHKLVSLILDTQVGLMQLFKGLLCAFWIKLMKNNDTSAKRSHKEDIKSQKGTIMATATVAMVVIIIAIITMNCGFESKSY